METGMAERKLGEKGNEILVQAQNLERSIREQWNDEAIERIKQNGVDLIARANALGTETREDYEALLNFNADISGYVKTGSDYCDPFKKLAKQPHTLICNIFNMFAVPGDDAKKIVAKKMTEYRQKERARVESEERKAEALRKEQERKLREAEERKAEKELEKGNIEKAEHHLANAEAAYIPPVINDSAPQKTERTGNSTTSFVKDREVKVISKMAIIKAVASGQLPETVLDVNETAAKNWAKACGHRDYNANGIQIWEFERPVTRAASRK